MNAISNIYEYKGEEFIELLAGRYRAVIAPFLGSNVIRMQDTEEGIEIFRFDESLSIEDLLASPEVYGLPTLYLPNRLAGGVLKTSDATYQFPLNDPLGHHIHGFLHKRKHTIVSTDSEGDCAIAKTEYVYDENDEFFETFPVSFKAEFTFSLSDKGLSYAFKMTNTSKDRQLPFGVCNHTTINGPFTKTGNPLDMRLYVPIGEKWELNSVNIPTLEFLPHTNHDKQYLTGSLVPVKQDIDNDVFFAEMGSLDGKPFYGITATDNATGKKICYEVCKDFKFWIIWNDHGEKGFFCPEPSTWIIDAPNLPIPPSESGYVELAPGESKTLTEKIYTA